MSGNDKSGDIPRRKALLSAATLGGTILTPGVASAKRNNRDTKAKRGYKEYEDAVTDETGNFTLENANFDEWEVIIEQSDVDDRKQGNRLTQSQSKVEAQVNQLPDASNYDGPSEDVSIYQGKFKNAEPTIDPLQPVSDQKTVRKNIDLSPREKIGEVPSYVPGAGGCDVVVGADVTFQSFPAKYAKVSVGIGLCGYYLQLGGVTVGFLKDNYFCLKYNVPKIPAKANLCAGVHHGDDALSIKIGGRINVPPNNPCSPAVCQVSFSPSVGFDIATPSNW